MKIGILSRNRHLYSTRRLIDAARGRGHAIVLIDTARVALALGYRPGREGRPPRKPRPSYHRVRRYGFVPQVDGIIPRIGASVTAQGVFVVGFYQAQGVPTTATAEAIARSRSKFRSLEIMRAAGLPMPRTVQVGAPEKLDEATERVGGFPLLIKLDESTHGRGVWLIPNLATAVAVQEILLRRGHQMLVQEFIEEAAGTDVRLIIVGERCVAAMKRQATAGEFRSNLHRGGTAVAFDPSPEMVSLAVRAARSHQLDVTGVDIIQSDRGPLLLETNSSPGLEGIEGATGRDVASAIVHHLEGLATRQRSRKQRQRSRR